MLEKMKDIRRKMWKLNGANRPSIKLQNLNLNFQDNYSNINPSNQVNLANRILLNRANIYSKNHSDIRTHQNYSKNDTVEANNLIRSETPKFQDFIKNPIKPINNLRFSLEEPTNNNQGQELVNPDISFHQKKFLIKSPSKKKKMSLANQYAYDDRGKINKLKSIIKNPSAMHIAGDIRNKQRAYDLNEAYTSNKIRGFRSDKVTKKSPIRNPIRYNSRRKNGPSAWELINYDSDEFKSAVRAKEKIRNGLEFIRRVNIESPIVRRRRQFTSREERRKEIGGSLRERRVRNTGKKEGLRENKSMIQRMPEFVESKPVRKLNQSTIGMLQGDYDMFEDYNLKKKKEKMILELVMGRVKRDNLKMKKEGLMDVTRRRVIPAGVRSDKSMSPGMRFHEKAMKEFEMMPKNEPNLDREEDNNENFRGPNEGGGKPISMEGLNGLKEEINYDETEINELLERRTLVYKPF